MSWDFFPWERRNISPPLLFIPYELLLSPYHIHWSLIVFHDRWLGTNGLTSIPSGAFTGLTALSTLWGRVLLWFRCGWIMLSSFLKPPRCMQKSVSEICLISTFLWLILELISWFALVAICFLEIAKIVFLLFSPLYTICRFLTPTHCSLILSVADRLEVMQWPASLRVSSSAWQRWKLCEWGCCYAFVCIDCVI